MFFFFFFRLRFVFKKKIHWVLPWFPWRCFCGLMGSPKEVRGPWKAFRSVLFASGSLVFKVAKKMAGKKRYLSTPRLIHFRWILFQLNEPPSNGGLQTKSAGVCPPLGPSVTPERTANKEAKWGVWHITK